MLEPTGQGVNDQGTSSTDPTGTAAGQAGSQSGSGAPAGQGAGQAGDKGQGQGGIVDQELDLVLADGRKIKVKASDVVDDQGVPYRNRFAEEARKRQDLEQRIPEPGQAPEGQLKDRQLRPGEFKDPTDDQIYTEEDLNRMMMTGEGVKAQRIILSQVDVRREVTRVVTEQETKARTLAQYPDLQNRNSVFFRRVATIMQNDNLYDSPRGLQIAAREAAAALTEEGVPFTFIPSAKGTAEGQRGSQTQGGVRPGGGAGRPITTTPELDEAGKSMASKLGVDPTKMAQRLERHLSTRTNSHREE